MFPLSKNIVYMHFCLCSSRFVITLHNVISQVVSFQLLAEFALYCNFRLWNLKKVFLMVSVRQRKISMRYFTIAVSPSFSPV